MITKDKNKIKDFILSTKYNQLCHIKLDEISELTQLESHQLKIQNSRYENNKHAMLEYDKN